MIESNPAAALGEFPLTVASSDALQRFGTFTGRCAGVMQ